MGLDHPVLCGESTWPSGDNENKTKTWGTGWAPDSKPLKTSIRDAKQYDVWSW